MAPIESLPQELIEEILSHLSDLPASTHHSRHVERNRALKHCSLVHRSWTQIARRLLAHEVWISPRDQMQSPPPRRILCEPRSSQRPTKLILQRTMLMLDDDNDILFDDTDSRGVAERWQSVKFLKIVVATTTFVSVACLPNLTRLHLAQVELYTEVPGIDSASVSLRHLAHLVLDDVEIRGNFESCRSVFSPNSMPRLVHLALDASHQEYLLRDSFAAILPQLKTLALSSTRRSNATVGPAHLSPLHDFFGFERAPRIAETFRLEHVSLHRVEQIEQGSLTTDSVLWLENLRSLHIDPFPASPRFTVDHDFALAGQLGMWQLLLRGRAQSRVSSRPEPGNTDQLKIVLYGWPPAITSFQPTFDVDVAGYVEWAETSPAAPFADFDGRW